MIAGKHLEVIFFRTDSGSEPVREWLHTLSRENKLLIGAQIKTVQYGWPLGMPVVRKLSAGLWEIRTHLDKRIARVFFTVVGRQIILLHGFIKKSQKTPEADLRLAVKRKQQVDRWRR